MRENTETGVEQHELFNKTRKILDAVDQDAYRAILSDTYGVERKVDSDRLFVPMDTVQISDTEDDRRVMGNFNFETDFVPRVRLFPGEISKTVAYMTSNFVDKSTYTPLFVHKLYEFLLLQTLVHEQIHVFGFYNSHYNKSSEVGTYLRLARGFKLMLIPENKDLSTLEHGFSFDEAYVDYRANMVTEAYLSTDGGRYIMPEDVESLSRVSREGSNLYKIRGWIFEQLIAVIAGITHRDESEALKLFDEAYLHTGRIISSALNAEIENVLPGLVNELESKLAGRLDDLTSPIYDVFETILKRLPSDISEQIKDRFAEIYRKYNHSEAQQENWGREVTS